MFRRRLQAVKSGKIDFKYFKSYEGEGPRDLQIIKNHFANQFEIPILFMMTCLCAFLLKTATVGIITCASLFVLSRIAHSVIHLGSNKVQYRALSYALGLLLMLGMWLQIIVIVATQS